MPIAVNLAKSRQRERELGGLNMQIALNLARSRQREN